MKLSEIKSVGVVGAGTMGLGIAQLAAMAGFPTTMYDLDMGLAEKALVQIEKNLQKGVEKGKVDEHTKKQALQNIRLAERLDAVNADLVVEAVIEQLAVKKALFADLEGHNSPHAILASNTSSIPITRIAANLRHPGRFVGLHFFNPAHIMKLVEVISGAATDPETAETAKAFAEKLGKTAVMAKDMPGFIVNRVARHFYVESLLALEEGVADVAAIDRLMEASGFRMGPFKLMDLIGVDTNFAVTTSMFEAFHQDSKFRPSRIQRQKVDAGHHGKKTGKGFYDYQ